MLLYGLCLSLFVNRKDATPATMALCVPVHFQLRKCSSIGEYIRNTVQGFGPFTPIRCLIQQNKRDS